MEGLCHKMDNDFYALIVKIWPQSEPEEPHAAAPAID